MCYYIVSDNIVLVQEYEMKRKIYDILIQWKNTSSRNTTLLIDGAHGVGNDSQELGSNG